MHLQKSKRRHTLSLGSPLFDDSRLFCVCGAKVGDAAHFAPLLAGGILKYALFLPQIGAVLQKTQNPLEPEILNWASTKLPRYVIGNDLTLKKI